MKRRELERHLRAVGCRHLHGGGKHDRWVGPRGALSVVPRHREIDFRLARKICDELEVAHPRGPR